MVLTRRQSLSQGSSSSANESTRKEAEGLAKTAGSAPVGQAPADISDRRRTSTVSRIEASGNDPLTGLNCQDDVVRTSHRPDVREPAPDSSEVIVAGSSHPSIAGTTQDQDTKLHPADVSPTPVVPPVPRRRHSDLLNRFVSSLVMSAAFVLVILGGHMWVAISVIAMEIGMFREILGLGYTVAVGGRIPLWRTTGWYFFTSCLFLFYGKSVLAHFEDQGRQFMTHPAMQYALRHHTFISFTLYCAGFVGFVLSLKQGHYQYQFSYFGRALAALVLVVVQSHFMILNVKQGLIWFILPSTLVIVNDSFAYVCGRLFGRHSLTSLSPKKTWEGYIGAGICTLITAFFLSRWLARFPFIVCPKYEFTDCIYYCRRTTCNPLPSVFIPRVTHLNFFPRIVPPVYFSYMPIQLHALALGLFASAIAPFGGFFASGAKRAFNIKDFANLFPGHGGVTDRVDCQLLMAVFSYVYIINFIDPNVAGSPDVGKVMAFVSELSTSEQIQLLLAIQSRLQQKGVILGNIIVEGSRNSLNSSLRV